MELSKDFKNLSEEEAMNLNAGCGWCTAAGVCSGIGLGMTIGGLAGGTPGAIIGGVVGGAVGYIVTAP